MKMEVTVNQVSPETSGDSQGWVLVNVKLLVGLLGMAACVAWMVIMLTTGVARGMTPAGEFSVMLSHLAFVGGMALMLGLAGIAPGLIASHRIASFIVSCIVGIASLVLTSFGVIAGEYLWIAYLFSGLATGCLFTLYGEYLATYFSNKIENYIVGVFLLMALILVFLNFVEEESAPIFAGVLLAFSYFGYFTQIVFYKVHRLPVVSRKDSQTRSKIVWRSYLATATSGMVLGFSMGCIGILQDVHPLLFTAMTVAGLVFCSIILYDYLHEHIFNESFSMRWFLPVAAVLAFPMLFVGEIPICLLAILMLCAALVPEICSMSALCRHIELCDLSAVSLWGIGRGWSVLGILVGLLLACFGLSQYTQELWGTFAMVGAVCVYILLIIISASFVMTEDNYPTEERIRVTEDEEGSKSVTVGKGTPIRKLDTRPDPDEEGDSGKRIGVFQLKCDAVAEQYGLSKRQKEVLALLARGRNADYITERLVISPHTAKAHTYNIYLKLDVHSRQELMDLVENTVISDEALQAARQKQ